MTARTINGFEKYQIDEDGNIFNKKTGKLLKYRVNDKNDSNSKLSCDLLDDNGKKRKRFGHILVYENFIGEILPGHFVKNIDGNIHNLNYKNLKLVSKKDVHKKYDETLLDKNKEWKYIEGYNNDYMISNYGDIYSIKNGKMMSPYEDQSGYVNIRLTSDKREYAKGIHRLVYQTFTGPLEDNLVIDHIDGKRSNNFVENLRQVTSSENRNNLTKQTTYEHKVKQYDLQNNFIKEWNSVTEILNACGFKTRGCIVECLKGCRKDAYGYIWQSDEYVKDSSGYIEIPIIGGKSYSNYKININGDVINKHNKTKKQRTNNGYKEIGLTSDDGKETISKVHRVVGATFLTNVANAPVVNHLDKRRYNNHVSNLEYVTHRENMIHSNGKKVAQICLETGNTIMIHESVRDAHKAFNKKYGSSIRYACKGDKQRKSAYGFGWSFVEA